MLRIAVPSTGSSKLTFATFQNGVIPSPPNGVDAEINNDVILLFEDEEEAIAYAESLVDLGTELDNEETPEKLIINDIATAIYNNDFIKSYREEEED